MCSYKTVRKLPLYFNILFSYKTVFCDSSHNISDYTKVASLKLNVILCLRVLHVNVQFVHDFSHDILSHNDVIMCSYM